MQDLPADDVELAEWLLAQWDEGRGTAKSQLERVAWADDSSHGRRFDRFIRQVLGVETSMPSKQSDRIADLADQVRSLGGRPRGMEPPAWEARVQQARAAGRSAVAAWSSDAAGVRFNGVANHLIRAWTALAVAVLGQRSEPLDGRSSERLMTAAFPKDDHSGTRANVEYFQALLDAVGTDDLPALDAIIAPQVQASLVNLDRHIEENFGALYRLGRSLTVPLDLGGFLGVDGFASPKALIRTLPNEVRAVLALFDTAELLNDPSFAFRLAIVPIPAVPGDRFDAMAYHATPGAVPAELAEVIDRKLAVPRAVRPPRPNLSAKDVVEQVQGKIPFRFTMNGHTEATYRLKVRSRRGDNAPDAFDPEYCEWVSSVKRHLFNDKWVERLVDALSTEAGYTRAVGRKPALNEV